MVRGVLREKQRYSREIFSELVGISPKFLYEIEVGQKGFSADTLYKIANQLNVTCEYILTGKNNELPNQLIEVLSLFDNTKINSITKILYELYELL